MDEEKLKIENAQAYRDYANYFGSLASGLFIASGIGVSLAAMSLNSSTSFMALGLRTLNYNNINATLTDQMAGNFTEMSVTAARGVNLGGALNMILIGAAFVFAVEGINKWKRSQAILNDAFHSSKRYRMLQAVIILGFWIPAVLLLL
ncbi:MAG: hypothetical protein ACI83Q_000781 [Colwellia polaris]|jgi:hypothetical protein